MLEKAIDRLLLKIIALRRVWIDNTDSEKSQELWDASAIYDWHIALQEKFLIHPSVKLMFDWGYEPKDIDKLVLEWPHISEKDPSRLAYTRDEKAGQQDRQLVTSIGKFLKRHWPEVDDHILRNANLSYSPDSFEITQGVKKLIEAVELGPKSCMNSLSGNIPFCHRSVLIEWLEDDSNEEPNWEDHPYVVYAEEFGWKMATRKSKDEILGRCLLLGDGQNKCFVRSYCKPKEDGSNSQADHALEAWLENQGYEKLEAWPEGAKMAFFDNPDEEGPFVPYIDGDGNYARRVRVEGDYLVIDRKGPWLCDNTDGEADWDDISDQMCPCCNQSHPRNGFIRTRDGDEVCNGCISRHYVTAYYTDAFGEERTAYMLKSNTEPVYNSYRHYQAGDVYAYAEIGAKLNFVRTVHGVLGTRYDTEETEQGFYFDDFSGATYLRYSYEVGGRTYSYALTEDVVYDAEGYALHKSEPTSIIEGKLYATRDVVTCVLTGVSYPPGTNTNVWAGKTYVVEACERVSSDAEWGDEDMCEIQCREALYKTSWDAERWLYGQNRKVRAAGVKPPLASLSSTKWFTPNVYNERVYLDTY